MPCLHNFVLGLLANISKKWQFWENLVTLKKRIAVIVIASSSISINKGIPLHILEVLRC